MAHDKAEILFRTVFLQQIYKFLPHGFDARAHFVQLGNPLRFEFRVLQHHCHRGCAVRRGVGIQRADDGFHLAERPRGGFFVVRHQRERAHALVVHTEIFGIRAGNQHFAVVLQKDAQAVGILFQAVGKALIGEVKQRQPAFFGRHFCQRCPLLGRGVYACGVVAAAVQQHHIARLRLG